MSGYGNSARPEGPPRNVLSQETIHNAMKQATSAASRPTVERRATEKSSRSSESRHQEGCDCANCYNRKLRGNGSSTPPRSSHGTKRIDANGDTVEEYQGDSNELRLGLHNIPPSPPPEEQVRKGGKSSPTTRKPAATRGHSYTNAEGDRVEEWDGPSAPRLRTHYDEDAISSVRFPGEGPPARPRPERSESSRSQKGGRPQPSA